MEEFVKEQEQWRNRLAWSEVYKVEKDMAELEVELDSYRGTHTTELAQQRRKTEEQLEQSKTNLAEVKARLTECTEKTSQAKNDLEAAKVKRAQLAGQAIEPARHLFLNRIVAEPAGVALGVVSLDQTVGHERSAHRRRRTWTAARILWRPATPAARRSFS